MLKNGARPSGAMVYEPKDGTAPVLTDEQFARIKTEISEQYSGARNAGRPLILDGNLRWQEISLSPRDMDWLSARDATSRDQRVAVPNADLGLGGEWLAGSGEQAIKSVQIERRVLAIPLHVAAHGMAQDRLAVRDRALDRGVVVG